VGTEAVILAAALALAARTCSTACATQENDMPTTRVLTIIRIAPAVIRMRMPTIITTAILYNVFFKDSNWKVIGSSHTDASLNNNYTLLVSTNAMLFM